jgi:nickel-dependent lactate racemase
MKLRVSTGKGLLDLACPAAVDIQEASSLAGLEFIVDMVPDWRGFVAGIVGGDPLAAWHKGVEISMTLSSTAISRIADVVLVSAGGYPFDGTLYSAVDCLDAALRCSRYDGVIVLVAECAHGIGPTGFEKGLLEAKSEKDVLAAAKRRFEVGMEKSRLLRQATDTRKLILCSRLQEPRIEKKVGCSLTSDLAEALEVARNHLGSWNSTVILPSGPTTLVHSS